MNVVKRVKENGSLYGWAVWCPACKEAHVFDAKRWTFDGNEERPTFSPSMLVRTGHHVPAHKAGEECWCTYNAAHPDDPSGFSCNVCHSFVVAGVWQYLGDCTHELKGQNVPVPPMPGIVLAEPGT